MAEWQVTRPATPLRPHVRRYVGYRFEGFPPGVHLGLPSRHLTVVIGLGEPTLITEMPDPDQAPGSFDAFASGVSSRRAVLQHDGREHGIQLELTPSGARSLLGVPAGELGPAVVGLDVLLGPAADEAAERMAALDGWAARFQVLDALLLRRAGVLPPAAPELELAWARIVDRAGSVRVTDLAAEVGWSRRHLGARFLREFGVTPKEAARVVRFETSRLMLARPERLSLSEVAVACGFYDQAHLCREWAALAGCSPTSWLANEQFPSVQDES